MKRVALFVLVALAAAPAAAKPGKRSASAAHKPAPVAERAPSDGGHRNPAPTSTAADTAGTEAETTAAAGTTTATSAGAGANKIKTKTYTFGAMDVEGKLKTPQLLYFLNRVKLELDMSAPDKRSFMKELERSADDKSL